MRIQSFIILLLLSVLLLGCSFAKEATTDDIGTLDTLDDINKQGTLPEVRSMLEELDAVEDVQPVQQQITYEALGCYKDNQVDPRPLPELLADLTGEVDWYDPSKVIKKCAKLASEKGYTVFGLQSIGHCRSGKNAAETYNSDGESPGCHGGLGGKRENLVFKIIPQKPPTTVSTVTTPTSPTKQTSTTVKTTTKAVTTESTTSLPTTAPVTIPLECQSYVTLTSINRSANNDKKGSSCDDKLPRGWYRFAGPAGNMMPTTCVPIRHCGTHAPGWLNGAHPAVHEGTVRRDVCFHWKSCCSWRNSVLVRNCGSFYVYYLSPPLTCNLGYCGNGQQEPPTSPAVSTVTTTEPETTTPASTTKTTKETTTPAPTTKTTKEPTTLPATTKKSTTPASSSRPPPTPPPSPAPECLSYSYLDSADRSMNLKADVHSAKCDEFLQQGWYRFRGDAGDQMPTSCVAVLYCGTHAPGWLSTSHPTVAQGAVRAKVCFHWGNKCCRWSTYIKVRNCSGFYVYELKKPPTCRLRYCGNGVQAPTTTPASPSTRRSTPSSTSSPSPTLATSPSNPSECFNYKFLNESNRAQGYSSRYRPAICDNKLSEDWYRFSGGAGDKMPEHCVDKLSCGTHAPGWLNTSHPSVADGAVETNVCFHWGSDCCYWSATIKVRNCGGFFVYQLSRTPYCSLRYCGNKRHEPTPTTPHSSTPSASPSPTPAPECSSYSVLSTGDRSQNYEHKKIQGAKPTCDRWLPKAWYRFTGMAGDRMPDQCVPSYRCGTHAPGWLRGVHPLVSEGVVSRTVCYSWRGKCCSWRSTISVRNCGSFYVYKLQRAPKCKLRYCGVGLITNASTTARPTTARPTTARPITARPTTTLVPTWPTTRPLPKYGFIILCLPNEIRVHVKRRSLPAVVDPSLLRLDDPRCGVVQIDDNDVMLTTQLDRCGTTRRTYDESVSFHNKVVADSKVENKRSIELPFSCSYKKLPKSDVLNQLEPLYPLNKRGQVMDSTLTDPENGKQQVAISRHKRLVRR
ncbi:uncharacterized protein LOC144642401 isoform X1 [Oculina patagonica]